MKVFHQYRIYIAAAIIILAAELTLFNLSTYRSFFYKEESLLERMQTDGDLTCTEQSYYSASGEFTLLFPSMDHDIHNLHLNFTTPKDVPLNYYISLTDEGNAYEYDLPETQLISTVSSTLYQNIYPYGRVHSLALHCNMAPGSLLTISDITINCRRPLQISVLRMVVLYVLFLFLYLLRADSPLTQIPFDYSSKKQGTVTFCTILLFVALGLFMTSSNKLFREQDKPHHEQYKELAVALSEGHVYLDAEPSVELQNAPNPYDTIYLQANHIDYRMDYSYYNGRYYVYFGIVPELLFYLPCYLLTGKLLPNRLVVFGFYCLFVLSIFMLFRSLLKRYHLTVPFYVYLLVSSATVFTGTYAFLIERADLYNVPVMGGLAFTAFGLWMWLQGLLTESAHDHSPQTFNLTAGQTFQKCAFCFAGSLSMALVAGCRPQMLLFSFLVFPLFWRAAFQEKKFFTRKTLIPTLCMILPYLMVACIVMIYNHLRFESVFDFGATYSLTNNDMNLRGTNLHRMLYGLWCFLFQPLTTKGFFPFITSANLDTSYMGRMVTEYFYGGIISCHILTYSLFTLFSRSVRGDCKKKQLTLPLLFLLTASLVIGLVDANQAGILQRYSADMSFGIYCSTAIIIFVLADRIYVHCPKNSMVHSGSVCISKASDSCTAPGIQPFFLLFLRIGFLAQMIYAFMVSLATEGGISMQLYNPEVFQRIAAMFRF